MRHRGQVACVAVIALGLMLGGCGSNGTHTISGDGRAAPVVTPPRPAFDPPNQFDAADAVRLPDEASGGKINLAGDAVGALPIGLFNTTAYIATLTNLLVVDTATGQVATTITPEYEAVLGGGFYLFAGSNPVQPPFLVDLDGVPTVLVPFLVKIPGAGTTAAKVAVEIVAVRAESAQRLWSMEVLLDDYSFNAAQDYQDLKIVGMSGDVVVLSAGATTYGIDAAARKTAWQAPGFRAVAVTGSMVVGVVTDDVTDRRAGALNTADGKQAWVDPEASYQLSVQPAGPKFVLVSEGGNAFSNSHQRVVDASTGKTVTSADRAVGDPSCYFDGVSVTACSTDDWAGALDATTGTWLWELPDQSANRTAIQITAAWHGAVYGTTGNGPLVLDGRTGADRQTSPATAPYVINGYLAIGQHPTEKGLFAFPAIG